MASSKCINFDWNIETTKLLINLYEENECLYNNFTPDYKNRDKRLGILTNIAKIISDTTGRVCLVADVRKKINSLRSQYLTEKLKIIKRKSGSDGDYTPTAYWFPMLRFLDVSTEADYSQSNLDTSQQSESEAQSNKENVPSNNVDHRPKLKKKKKLVDEDSDLIKEATTTLREMSQHISSARQTDSKNEISNFCNFVGSELSSMLEASNNKYYVKKAKRKIQMCLFEIWDEIDMGNFEKSKSVITGTAKSLIIKRKKLNDNEPNVQIIRTEEDTESHGISETQILSYINEFDPQDQDSEDF